MWPGEVLAAPASLTWEFAGGGSPQRLLAWGARAWCLVDGGANLLTSVGATRQAAAPAWSLFLCRSGNRMDSGSNRFIKSIRLF